MKIESSEWLNESIIDALQGQTSGRSVGWLTNNLLTNYGHATNTTSPIGFKTKSRASDIVKSALNRMVVTGELERFLGLGMHGREARVYALKGGK